MTKIEKIHFSISEVAEIVDVKPYVLRYWEKEFNQIKPVKNNVGVRKYTRPDIEIILHIKELLYDKQFTIKGAKAKLISEKEKRHHSESTHSEESHKELLEIKSKVESLLKFMDSDQSDDS